jgi:YidC/Oxa1 family membrane protein insertase
MDKKSGVAFLLIAIVVIGFTLWQQYDYKKRQEEKALNDTTLIEPNTSQSSDTANAERTDKPAEEEDESGFAKADTVSSAEIKQERKIQKYGPTFAPFADKSHEYITIESKFFEAVISTNGATVQKWRLKEYDKWDKVPVQLIRAKEGDYFINFLSQDGQRIDSRDLRFEFEGDKEKYVLGENDSLVLKFRLQVKPGSWIQKELIFSGGSYTFGSEITLNNMEEFMGRGYNLVWAEGLFYQEYNSVDEANDAKALAQVSSDIVDIDATNEDETETLEDNGIIDYVASKIKYFGVAIKPMGETFNGRITLIGERELIANEGVNEIYSMSIAVPYEGGVQTDEFLVFLGPLEYDRMKELGLEGMVNFGWKYGIRQIGEYFMLPIFNFIHRFVPNYGVSIILFSILMKILLYPLTITQLRSARKMQLLSPEMTKIREKYKDDQTKQQQEIMKLYQTYGVNPAGGCFPLLLQMPILIALWQLLRSNIDLRQSDFILWINDLSRPDILFEWGFSIIGIKHFSGLAILMGASMFIQQKMTITDPRQKSLMYIMPLMFTFMFSNFPAGLNLYYFMFNLLGIGQHIYMNKFAKNQITLDEMKKKPKKEGWIQKKMREAQEMAEAQGRSVPGAPKKGSNQQQNRPNNRRKKK